MKSAPDWRSHQYTVWVVGSTVRSRVRVAVVDDGASLSPRRLQALQEPGPAGARRGGIGLPLVRLLLARQGTTLELRAASGAGLWAGFVLDAVTSPVDSPGG